MTFTAPIHLLLPASLLQAIIQHAHSELPNECCGFLAGVREAGIGRIHQHFPLINALASTTEFLSEERSLFAAIKTMRHLGFEELAIYHSHPTSNPIPSRRDRERNYSPTVANFIISLQDKQPSVQAWWLTAETATEASWEVVAG